MICHDVIISCRTGTVRYSTGTRTIKHCNLLQRLHPNNITSGTVLSREYVNLKCHTVPYRNNLLRTFYF